MAKRGRKSKEEKVMATVTTTKENQWNQFIREGVLTLPAPESFRRVKFKDQDITGLIPGASTDPTSYAGPVEILTKDGQTTVRTGEYEEASPGQLEAVKGRGYVSPLPLDQLVSGKWTLPDGCKIPRGTEKFDIPAGYRSLTEKDFESPWDYKVYSVEFGYSAGLAEAQAEFDEAVAALESKFGADKRIVEQLRELPIEERLSKLQEAEKSEAKRAEGEKAKNDFARLTQSLGLPPEVLEMLSGKLSGLDPAAVAALLAKKK